MRSAFLAAVVLAPMAALAQAPAGGHGGGHRGGHPHDHGAAARADMPYAGFQTREIKALSPDQIADLRAGRGMAMALPAELNRYPGPLHALDHAADLALTQDQITALRRLMADMRERAIIAGERLIAAERSLDRLFAEGRADTASLGAAVGEAALAQGALREVHLSTHVATRALLSAGQIDAYDRVRGYR